MKLFLRNIVDKLSYVQTLKSRIQLYELQMLQTFVPPGHFYSPIVDANEIVENNDIVFNNNRNLDGVNLNTAEQFELIEAFKNYYKLLFFSDNPCEGKRYFYKNNFFSYSDVIFLFSMLMHKKPKKIIE